jgi:serine/threonine protein phosphatase PrpC
MRFEIAMQTDTGQVRQNNEDSCFAFDTGNMPEPEHISYGVYVVADGMGGHQAGEIASHKAIEIIRSVLLEDIEKLVNSDINKSIQDAFQKANSEIYSSAINDPRLIGMGTTVTLGLRNRDRLYIGHVGDSRAYLLRAENITQLTRDHSLVENLKSAGMITEEESKIRPDRNIITRAIGTSSNVVIDSFNETIGQESLTLSKNDRLLFCTDGLTNFVDNHEILDIVGQSTNAAGACEKLISIANQRGGNDNITVIVVNSI